ncbi:conserved Plasmodium protein, unknown function, partial [Plasmodium sp. gorilla clade G3]
KENKKEADGHKENNKRDNEVKEINIIDNEDEDINHSDDKDNHNNNEDDEDKEINKTDDKDKQNNSTCQDQKEKEPIVKKGKQDETNVDKEKDLKGQENKEDDNIKENKEHVNETDNKEKEILDQKIKENDINERANVLEEEKKQTTINSMKESENICEIEKNLTSNNIMKYNELSNPILLNFMLLTNIQKEKNIKKCEKDNIKNKISDIYLLLSMQFIYNYLNTSDDDLNNMNISFFKVSNYNFLYIYWNIINVHVNNLYLRIITLKLLVNLTLLYVQKIKDKNVCTSFVTPLLVLMEKIKKKLANKIKSIICKMEYKVCQIFWEESKIYENCCQEKINICGDSILMNIVNEAEEFEDYHFLSYPVSQIEIYRRNVHALFVLNGFSSQLQDIISNTKIDPMKSVPFDFSYKDATALIDIKNKNTIKCFLKNNNKIFNCYYIEDKTNFLLCIPSNSHVNQALIIFSYPLMLIDLYIDKNDNKKLIVHAYSYNNEENNVDESVITTFNNSEKIFNNNNTYDSNYVNIVRCYSSNNDDNISDENVKIHKNDYILNKYSSAYKKNKTITNVKKEWCIKELNFMKNILKLNFYDTTRSLIVYKEIKSGIQSVNDKYKKQLEEYLDTFN